MHILPVVLWTDALVFLLVIGAMAFVFWIRHDEQSRATWRAVFRRPMAMSAFVILMFFVIIGVFDSMHFKVPKKNGHNGQQYYSTKVYSVLDKMLWPLGQQYERTYSKPFALRAYSKSVINTPQGDVRDFASLQFAGKSLSAPQDKIRDIIMRTLIGAGIGIVIWLLLVGLMRVFGKKALQSNQSVAMRQFSITLLFIVLLSSIALKLSGNYHIFGTDKVGKDVFFEAIKSIRTGLVIGTVTTVVMLPFAIMLGAMAGYFRGWIDDVIQYVYTTLSSVPGVLLISASVLALQVYISNNQTMFPTLESRADARLLALCLILGVTSWTGLCRLLRAETLKLREMDFVRASLSMGVHKLRIITRHIVPNIMHIVLITVVLDFSALVLAEAVLSYVGVGVDPTTMSWGNMINSARLDLAREPIVWWPLLAAFIFMFTLVLSANLFADAVRDAFDPRLRDVE